MARGRLLVVLIQDINIQDDDVLAILLPFIGNNSARSQNVVLVVNAAKLHHPCEYQTAPGSDDADGSAGRSTRSWSIMSSMALRT
jgi:hypothetical protein